MSKYAEHVQKMTGLYESKEVKIEVNNYISRDDMMLRGNNRKNTYSLERVRIGRNDRKR